MSLSDRIRPNSEAAPWVCEEVKKLELKLAEVKKQRDALMEAGERLQRATMNLKCPQPLEEWLTYTTASIEFENALTAVKGGEG